MQIVRCKNKRTNKITFFVVMTLINFCFTGCNKSISDKAADSNTLMLVSPMISITPTVKITQNIKKDNTTSNETKPEIVYVDYKDCFDGIKGCAVFFNRDKNVYALYNKELCEKRTFPCSTFKIIATLMGLEKGVITSADSKMGYDGTIYFMDKWNKDLNLKDAFKESCIWYFRKVIDQVGQSNVQGYIDKLKYGNCDISEWNGSGINLLPQMNGFWLESSLKISPIEQVNVLADIFNNKAGFSKKNVEILKEVMFTKKIGNTSVYGKTGTGQNIKTKHKDSGWFVGMIENVDEVYYFAVRITGAVKEVTGTMAKEIALNIIKQHYTEK